MSYEHYGDKFRIILGDLNKEEYFGPGGQFQVELSIGQDLAEFSTYGPEWPKNHRDKVDHVSHSLIICFWRWGLYVSVAGRPA